MLKGDYRICDITSHGDQRGQLIAIENNKDLDFEIKRVYYIYNTSKGVVRGKHAHKELKQFLICVNGQCKIRLCDAYENETIVTLDSPSKGLFIEGLIWREMYDFSDHSVLLVLASELYDESDYIRDYDQFINLAKEMK